MAVVIEEFKVKVELFKYLAWKCGFLFLSSLFIKIILIINFVNLNFNNKFCEIKKIDKKISIFRKNIVRIWSALFLLIYYVTKTIYYNFYSFGWSNVCKYSILFFFMLLHLSPDVLLSVDFECWRWGVLTLPTTY